MLVIVSLVRGVAVALAVATLVFCGFFTDPGMMALFDREYQKLAEHYLPERTTLVSRRLDMESDHQDRRQDLAEIDQKIETTRLRLKDDRDPDLQADLEGLVNLRSTVDSQILEIDKSIRRIQNDIDDLTRLIDRTRGQAENVYLVVRGISLGALGAFVYTLVHFLSRRRWAELFADGNIERTVAATLVGAIVAVVAFALFHTKQVSIFDVADAHPDARPDFWRVTILCLGAGAIAGQIYQRTSLRMDRIFGGLAPTGARAAEHAPPAPAEHAPETSPEAVALLPRDGTRRR